MTHDDRNPPAATAPEALADPALLRFLSPHLAAEIAENPSSQRAALETFIHLASTRHTIGTYLPRHLIERELAPTAEGDGAWVEWVEGALLFADVSGSTALAERLSALGREGTEIVTGALNDFFDTMIAVCDSYGGDLLSFGGDALLIFFDAADAAHTATAAALELLDRLAGFERHVPGAGTFSLTLHIGVERGRVALAAAGQPEARRYCALGTSVNSVARAEGYGGAGELVLGPGAWRDVAADAVGQEVAPGYWRVSALRASPARPAPDAAVEAASSIPELLHQLERLSPYLPVGLLPRIVADPQRPQVEADLRPVTVLFAQVVGLTPLVEALDERRAAAVLDELIRPVQTIIERFGGVVNKLDLADEGDKLLAIFGAPVAYEDHARRAAGAALAIMEFRQQTRARQAQAVPSGVAQRPSTLSLRLGLNTGTVFAGNVGTAQRKEYTVMGDAVNVAARVMASTAWGEVWCSEATAALVRDHWLCAERGRVAVKGKSEPLALCQLVGEREDADHPDERTPLIGRADELRLLREHLSHARDGHGRVLRVSGEAGMGKSRLVAELADAARAEGDRVMQVACLSHASSTPYAPWGLWLRQHCGIEADHDAAERLRRLDARLRQLGGGTEAWLPLLADLARLDVEETRLTRALDPQLRQARTFELLVALVRQAANEARGAGEQVDGSRALVIIFEDLHWADQISLDLWQQVASSLGDVPALLLGVHRPGMSWGSGSQSDGAHELQLRELPADDSRALIATHEGAALLPPALRDQLVVRAAGNPLFLEELLRALTAKLEGEERRLVAGVQSPNLQATIDELPDSLNGLLLARIDRLDESSRALLRVASVIGQRFPMGVLQAVQPSDQRALLRQLANLDEQDLTVTERVQPERVQLFRHALLQEVAYQSLLYARRRELHRRIGDYLQRRYSESLDAYYGLLAHHYRLSDQRALAVPFLLLAGHAAAQEYANDDAIQFYRWAEEILHDPGNAALADRDRRRWELHNALGDVLSTVGRYGEALEQYGAILAYTPPAPVAVRAEAHRDCGSALEKQGSYAEALEQLRHAEALCRDNLDEVPPLLLSEVCADRGLVLMRRGEYDPALAICGEGLSMLRRDVRSREDERIEARLHGLIGQIYGTRGDYATARHHFGSALAAQEAIDDLAGMSKSHNNIGYLWQLQGEYGRALEHYRLAGEHARTINLRYMLIFVGVNTAYANYHLSDYVAAERECQAALEICRSINDQRNIAQIEEVLGLLAYCRGRYDEALAHYAITRRTHAAAGSVYPEANTLIYEAHVQSALGSPAEALALARRALATAEELGAQQLKLEALNAIAEAHLAADEPQVAAGCASEAATLAGALGSKFDLAVAERLLGESVESGGEEHLERSIALFSEIRQRFELARSQSAYARLLARNGNQSAVHTYGNQAYETFVAIGAQGELARLAPFIERSV
jgi:class 3 adenylate cyclase/tetratricopeptide (TPR) repeat protein